jgi:succinoglycan biosynthesis protein ExoL
VFDRADCETLVRQLAALTLQAPQTVPVVAMAGSSHNEGGFL